MNMKFKALAAALAAVTALSCMDTAVYAEKWNIENVISDNEKAEYEQIYSSLLKITAGKGTDADWDIIVSDGDTPVGVLSDKEIGLLNDENSVVSFKTDLSLLKPDHLNSPDFHLYACFTFYTSAYEAYSCKIEIKKKQSLTAGELFEQAGVPSGEKITAVMVTQENSRDMKFTKGQPQDYKIIIWGYEPIITGVSVSAAKQNGWYTSADGSRYYYKNGVKVRKTWIKNKKGEYRYLGSDGRMVTGWYDVKQGKEGRFSWFNENGVWDGQTYYSRYNEYEGFGNTVTIKVARNEIISESMSRYLDNGLGSEKKARSYVLNNNEYELEIPLSVADQLTVGDKLIVSPNVKRGEKVDGEYQYKLCIPTLYSPNKGDEMYRYNKDSGTILEKVTEARMELFNKLLVLKSGKLKLDMMFGAYGLDWDYLESEDFYKEPYVYTHIRRDGDGNRYDEYTYGLFGGSNEFNKKTGKYAFRNNISEKTLKKLMMNKIAAHKEELEQHKNDDVDWSTWVINMEHLWLDVTVTDIPELPLSIDKRKFIDPPELTVTAGDKAEKADKSTYSWENEYTDINMSSATDCDALGALESFAFSHPLTMKDTEPVSLSFSTIAKPKQITVKCWKDEYKGDYAAYDKFEIVTVKDLHFTPKKGGYIYEIHASWDKFTDNDVTMSGNCYYTVYIIEK